MKQKRDETWSYVASFFFDYCRECFDQLKLKRGDKTDLFVKMLCVSIQKRINTYYTFDVHFIIFGLSNSKQNFNCLKRFIRTRWSNVRRHEFHFVKIPQTKAIENLSWAPRFQIHVLGFLMRVIESSFFYVVFANKVKLVLIFSFTAVLRIAKGLHRCKVDSRTHTITKAVKHTTVVISCLQKLFV